MNIEEECVVDVPARHLAKMGFIPAEKTDIHLQDYNIRYFVNSHSVSTEQPSKLNHWSRSLIHLNGY